MSEQASKELKQNLNKEDCLDFPILAVDYGSRYIGLAVSDRNGLIGSPYKTIVKNRKNGDQVLIEQIGEICTMERISSILLGIPQAFEDSHERSREVVMQFGEKLHSSIGVKLCYYDESFSTANAEEIIGTGVRKAKKSGKVDKLSAALFLQEYLDATSTNIRKK